MWQWPALRPAAQLIASTLWGTSKFCRKPMSWTLMKLVFCCSVFYSSSFVSNFFSKTIGNHLFLSLAFAFFEGLGRRGQDCPEVSNRGQRVWCHFKPDLPNSQKSCRWSLRCSARAWHAVCDAWGYPERLVQYWVYIRGWLLGSLESWVLQQAWWCTRKLAHLIFFQAELRLIKYYLEADFLLNHQWSRAAQPRCHISCIASQRIGTACTWRSLGLSRMRSSSMPLAGSLSVWWILSKQKSRSRIGWHVDHACTNNSCLGSWTQSANTYLIRQCRQCSSPLSVSSGAERWIVVQ